MAAATRKSLKYPFSLLLLLAILALISTRSAIPSGSGSVAIPLQTLRPVDPVNTTIIRLASVDPTAADLARDVDSLLEGRLPRGSHRSIASLYRLRRSGGSEYRQPALRFRIRSPQEHRLFPFFRRRLRDWFRIRRFDPKSLVSLLGGPHDSCAVVGNSGILLEASHGTHIDSHDVVIRLNNARIAGFSRHVGTKTSISFVNSNILHACARRNSCTCHPYNDPSVPMVMYICQPIHFLDLVTCNSSGHKITDLPFDLLCAQIVKFYSLRRFVEENSKVAEEWGKIHDEKAFHYSSGMQAVVLALGACKKVSVFGFGKSVEAKHHYHTNQKKELALHDYEAEYAFYRDLAERPEVIPFLKDSGLKVPPVVFYH